MLTNPFSGGLRLISWKKNYRGVMLEKGVLLYSNNYLKDFFQKLMKKLQHNGIRNR